MADSQGSPTTTTCLKCGRPRLEFCVILGHGVRVQVLFIPPGPDGTGTTVGVAIEINGRDATEALEHVAIALCETLETEFAALAASGQRPEAVIELVPGMVEQLAAAELGR